MNYKTPFMWAGSKDKDFEKIKQYIPKFKIYYEPFVGSGAIYFRLLAERGQFSAVLNDINPELINAYVTIRDYPTELCAGLPNEKDKEVYKNLRQSIPNNIVERAIKFLYMNRNSFFGLGGWMNADRYARNTIIKRIKFFSPLMKSTQILNMNCCNINIINDVHNFIFCDPPYPDTNNAACYKIDNTTMLELNINYLTTILNSQCNFLWTTKENSTILELVQSYRNGSDIQFSSKEWKFRKPGKEVQINKELYIWRKK